MTVDPTRRKIAEIVKRIVMFSWWMEEDRICVGVRVLESAFLAHNTKHKSHVMLTFNNQHCPLLFYKRDDSIEL